MSERSGTVGRIRINAIDRTSAPSRNVAHAATIFATVLDMFGSTIDGLASLDGARRVELAPTRAAVSWRRF